MRDDKRHLPRYPARLGGQYELLSGPPAERLQPTESIELGLRGCRLTTGQRTELVGLRVAVLLPIRHVRVHLMGTIVWARPPAAGEPGCMGVDLDPSIPLAYGELVAELASRAPARKRRSTPQPGPPPAASGARQEAMTAAERLRVALRAGRKSQAAASSPPSEHRPIGLPIDSLGLLPAPPPAEPCPAPPPEPPPARRSRASLARLDAVLLDFLAEARASQPPPVASPVVAPPAPPPGETDALLREFLAAEDIAAPIRASTPPPARQLDGLLRDFLAEGRKSSAPAPQAQIDAILCDFLAEGEPQHAAPEPSRDFSDQEIDELVGQLSSRDIELLEQLRDAVASKDQAPDAPTRRPSALVASDDPAAIEAHARELGPLFDVVPAATLDGALSALERPALELRAVVSDLALHGDASAGIVLLQQARRRLPGCARILLTGALPPELAAAYVREGVVQRALAGPCRPGELLAALRALVPRDD